MNTFEESSLNPEILKAIGELGYERPTEIQQQAIPLLLDSEQDLIAFAQTGTGKTAAFSLPILHQTTPEKHPQSLILAPTRELCLQIARDIESYSKYLKKIKVVALYGGSSIVAQMKDLSKGAQIVVGTPGRTLDLINRRKLDLSQLNTLVLDEADEMLSMGFKDELDAILDASPEERQTLLFSATIPKAMLKLAKKYMHDPVEISAGNKNDTTQNVHHAFYVAMARDRYLALKRIVDVHPNIYGIIFCRTRRETKEVADKLGQEGYNTDALHGDLSQQQRDYVMNRFRKKTVQILVATDVAARGLDVNELTHVINYNLPDDPDTYVHRSGRTGRAGNKGTSIIIVHSRELRRIGVLERKMGKKMEQRLIPSGKDICKKQLFKVVDKIENIEVNEEQIADFLPEIYKKLEWMEREELIKRFVSVEFDQFLTYYKGSRDLNAAVKGDKSKKSRKERNERNRDDRRDRGDRRDRRDRKDRDSRSERGDRRKGDRKKGRDHYEDRDEKRKSSKNWTRIFINLGRKNKLTPQDLLELLNQQLPDKRFQVGQIEIQRSFTFFDIEDHMVSDLITAFGKVKYRGVRVVVQTAAPDPAPKKKRRKAWKD